ncbi:hypothetical protein AB3S75_045334 [Citrus x aurantiifolia]
MCVNIVLAQSEGSNNFRS